MAIKKPALDNNEQLLQTAFSTLSKKYGQGIIMRLGDQQKKHLPTISTSSIKLNKALGIGGFPCGRIIEIYGPESSGKTTLAMHAIASAQQKGANALLIDTEHAFDKQYASTLGIDVENLLICQPDYGEQALDVAETCIRSEGVALVVIDSVSALVPEAEIKGDMGTQNVGGQARLMSQAMRKLTAIIHKTGVVCLFINQLRHKIGVMYGSPEVTSGGNALKFYASIRLDIRKVAKIRNKDGENIGQRSKIKIVKNKLSAPFQEVELTIYYGKGISQETEIVELGVSAGIIKQAGAWFSYEGKQLSQGKEALVALLIEDQALKERLAQAITAKMML
ncbi:MAG: recombinase RecA [Bacteroidota bacterium]